jgi:hypothetical protein
MSVPATSVGGSKTLSVDSPKPQAKIFEEIKSASPAAEKSSDTVSDDEMSEDSWYSPS